ncbi:MAG TPA: hypothetical protein VM029_01125 [Opitutaceae bacterium]|nr:hypothetical protein [Opitutaceae bacterium]
MQTTPEHFVPLPRDGDICGLDRAAWLKAERAGLITLFRGKLYSNGEPLLPIFAALRLTRPFRPGLPAYWS